MKPDPKSIRQVFGRRLGKPLRGGRLTALDALLPRLSIPREKLTEKADLTPEAIFGEPVNTLHVEIGFGNGEHLAWRMGQNPDHHFIGAELYINGMSAFLKSILPVKHDHVRVVMDDALLAINSLPDASVDFLYILNPDPWPKKRHYKRRMVRDENLVAFARVLKPGAMMIQTTDVDELAEWMLERTLASPDFEWLAERESDWKTAPDGWFSTRYEQKGAKAGRTQSYLIYRRK